MVDFTVFPANASYVRQSLDVVSNILAASPCHVAHIQMPVVQKQTTTHAVVKHRRIVEDHLLKSNVTLRDNVSLLFSREESTANDRRSLSQPCLASMFEDFRDCAFSRPLLIIGCCAACVCVMMTATCSTLLLLT